MPFKICYLVDERMNSDATGHVWETYFSKTVFDEIPVIYFSYLGIVYTLDLFMRIKNNATRKAVKTIILTFRVIFIVEYHQCNARSIAR